jgi:hypothetical protein
LPPPMICRFAPRLALLHNPMTLQHLLVPVDFSEGTLVTLAFAVKLAGKFSVRGLRQRNPQSCLSLSRFSDLPTAQPASGAREVRLRTSCVVEYAISPEIPFCSGFPPLPRGAGRRGRTSICQTLRKCRAVAGPLQGWGLHPIEIIEYANIVINRSIEYKKI